MLEAAIIGSGRSTPGLFSRRRRMRRLRRFNWRWTLAFTRKPPGVEQTRDVKYLDCSRKPGGFRASRPQNTSDYAWLRTKGKGRAPCASMAGARDLPKDLAEALGGLCLEQSPDRSRSLTRTWHLLRT